MRNYNGQAHHSKRKSTPLRTLQAPTAPFPSKIRLPPSLPSDWLAVPLNLGSSHPLRLTQYVRRPRDRPPRSRRPHWVVWRGADRTVFRTQRRVLAASAWSDRRRVDSRAAVLARHSAMRFDSSPVDRSMSKVKGRWRPISLIVNRATHTSISWSCGASPSAEAQVSFRSKC